LSAAANPDIENGLGRYAIGEKIRHLRHRKRMRLVELGSHSGLSASLISKLESGKLVPTLPTLLRIALVFEVGLDFFFSDEARDHGVSIVRANERMHFSETMGGKNPIYEFESLNYRTPQPHFHVFLAWITPANAGRRHEHEGVEFVYVMRGSLELQIETNRYVLQEGDSIYFDSIHSHGYTQAGEEKCAVLTVISGGS